MSFTFSKIHCIIFIQSAWYFDWLLPGQKTMLSKPKKRVVYMNLHKMDSRTVCSHWSFIYFILNSNFFLSPTKTRTNVWKLNMQKNVSCIALIQSNMPHHIPPLTNLLTRSKQIFSAVHVLVNTFYIELNLVRLYLLKTSLLLRHLIMPCRRLSVILDQSKLI